MADGLAAQDVRGAAPARVRRRDWHHDKNGPSAAPLINSRWFDDWLEIYGQTGIAIKLTSAARGGKLVPADMRYGTFTISNHGVSGSLLATPIIINQPQWAILGVGKLEKCG